jgi:large subunit ribosomal protein L10
MAGARRRTGDPGKGTERRSVDRAEKKQLVSDLHATFQGVSTVVVTRPNGLTVAEVSNLRRQMRDQGARYKVAKNRLARLALDGTQFEGLKPLLEGQTALAWSDDPVAAAKVAVDYANKNKKLEIIGGAYGERVLDAEGIEQLAKTPDLEESRAKIVGLLQTPASRVASVLQAPGGQIARVLAAYAEKDDAA